MKCNKTLKNKRVISTNKELHVISTGQQTAKTLVQIVTMIHKAVDAIHLRERKWTAAELIQVIEALTDRGVPFEKIIINDRVDIAQVKGVGGVQLAHHSINASMVTVSFPSLKVGCSVHSLSEALMIEKKGGDYLLYGHIHHTNSKKGMIPRGLDNLRKLTQQVALPVIAIGGITPGNTRETLAAGASGIAVMSGVFLADDPVQAVMDYRKAMQPQEVIP
ncbi:thiazole tautomerase TenI [Lentibacillus sp. N15]|uniref:thiazole tautomerase TenI n=1 Tax=Lentibacillus songyuanensis TaxID=3136161 RepID=UPI0031BB1FA2